MKKLTDEEVSAVLALLDDPRTIKLLIRHCNAILRHIVQPQKSPPIAAGLISKKTADPVFRIDEKEA
jgi:hypothetical protein